jgi:ABC-type lipoprotein release transport system permease subunit
MCIPAWSREPYFTSIKSKPALIGKKLAEKLQLDIKKKIYLTFVDENGDQQRIKLKVEGIFKTASTLFDRTNIYMKREDFAKNISKQFCHSRNWNYL